MYAEVIVDIATAAVDSSFTYRIPNTLSVEIGQHVKVPFGRGNTLKEGFVVAKKDDTELENVKDIAGIMGRLPVFSEEQLELSKWIRRAYHSLWVDALRLMIPAQLRGERVSEKVVRTVRIKDAEGANAALSKGMRSSSQEELLRLLTDSGLELALHELMPSIPKVCTAAAALHKKGLVEINTRSVYRRPQKAVERDVPPELTPSQRDAVDEITGLMDEGGKTALLFGVTGSGKTEVYLHALSYCAKLGKGAIVLVPEIALTPQTIRRFSARFGDTVAVLHSRLSAGERYDEWRRINEGKARIVVGARSAVFAPVRDLGLIVVDEEHESSYQSEKTPRYNAIEVAKKRMAIVGGTLILGSATPQLVSYYRALSGVYTLVELPERILGRPLPKVEVIDMQAELKAGNNGIFSDRLVHLLSDCFGAGRQAMLFINRRGYSSFVACRSCGEAIKCDNCDVSLTYHKSIGKAVCHYCGERRDLPEVCPSCGKPFIKHHGIGTEQVEEALNTLFPDVKAIRLDADAVRKRGALEELLGRFSKGEAQALIGTQMIAKGHDFPNVTLVGVVAADTTLNLPDFRSPERSFQLLTQVAGRAGRDEFEGSVVVQTFRPDSPVIRFSAAQDYPAFYQYEIAERKKLLYPPFSVFVSVLLTDEDERRLGTRGKAYAMGLEAALKNAAEGKGAGDILLLTADFAPVLRIMGSYRYRVLVKLLRTRNLPAMLDAVYAFHKESGEQSAAAIEINPQEMY